MDTLGTSYRPLGPLQGISGGTSIRGVAGHRTIPQVTPPPTLLKRSSSNHRGTTDGIFDVVSVERNFDTFMRTRPRQPVYDFDTFARLHAVLALCSCLYVFHPVAVFSSPRGGKNEQWRRRAVWPRLSVACREVVSWYLPSIPAGPKLTIASLGQKTAPNPIIKHRLRQGPALRH